MKDKHQTTKNIKTSINISRALMDEFRDYCKITKRTISAQIAVEIEQALEANRKKNPEN